jgi:hypothetical protein
MLNTGRNTINAAVHISEETTTSSAAFLSARNLASRYSPTVIVGTKIKKRPTFPFMGVTSKMTKERIREERATSIEGTLWRGVFTHGRVGFTVEVESAVISLIDLSSRCA